MSDELQQRFEDQNRSLEGIYKKTLDESKNDKEIRRQELINQTQRYHDSDELGQGAMKRILRSHDSKTKREVAKAILKNGQAGLQQDSFLREAELTAELEHPNIVPVHDIGLDSEGQAYFTMKLIGGENLATILAGLEKGDKEYSEKYSLAILLNIFQKICDALSFAHSRSILHLDLKPENIQIGDFGEVLVCDWGLARKLEDLDELSITSVESFFGQTLDGLVKGTPGYMAPEQAAGLNSQRSEKTDIYSLGALLYSLLTYKCPFDCKTLEEILEKTKKGDFKKPSEVRAHAIPASLEAVVMKAMALDCKNRYVSVDALKADISTYQNGFATRAEDASFITQTKLFFKRNQLALSLILSASFIISILTAYFILRLQEQVELAQKAEGEAFHAIADFQRINHEAAQTFCRRLEETFVQANGADLSSKVDFTVKLNPEHAESWMLKGRYHLSHFDIEDAKISFLKALQLIGFDKVDETRQKTMLELDRLQHMMVEFRDRWGFFPGRQIKDYDEINFQTRLQEEFEDSFLNRSGGKTKQEFLMDPYGMPYHFISWKGTKYQKFRRNRYFFDLWSEGPDRTDHQYYDSSLQENVDNLCNWPNNRASQVMRLEQLLRLCDSLAPKSFSLRSPAGFSLLNELRILNEVSILKNIFMNHYRENKPSSEELFSLLKLFNPSLQKNEFQIDGKKLQVRSPVFFDLMPLTGLDFESLDFEGSPVVDLRPLASMPLKEINLSSTNVYDFRGVHFGDLERADLSSLKTNTLRNLSAPQLKALTLQNVKLKNWEDLLHFSKLKELNIDKKWQRKLPASVKQRFGF